MQIFFYILGVHFFCLKSLPQMVCHIKLPKNLNFRHIYGAGSTLNRPATQSASWSHKACIIVCTLKLRNFFATFFLFIFFHLIQDQSWCDTCFWPYSWQYHTYQPAGDKQERSASQFVVLHHLLSHSERQSILTLHTCVYVVCIAKN